MGRKAKPIHLQILEGNKNRLTEQEIEQRVKAEQNIQPKGNRIKAPTWLNTVAKKEFNRISKELMELDLITNVDINALAAYCDAYSDYVECTKIIGEEGLMVEYTNKAAETNKVPHPLLTKKKQLHEQMKSLAIEFGLTPSSRASLAKPNAEKRFGDRV